MMVSVSSPSRDKPGKGPTHGKGKRSGRILAGCRSPTALDSLPRNARGPNAAINRLQARDAFPASDSQSSPGTSNRNRSPGTAAARGDLGANRHGNKEDEDEARDTFGTSGVATPPVIRRRVNEPNGPGGKLRRSLSLNRSSSSNANGGLVRRAPPVSSADLPPASSDANLESGRLCSPPQQRPRTSQGFTRSETKGRGRYGSLPGQAAETSNSANSSPTKEAVAIGSPPLGGPARKRVVVKSMIGSPTNFQHTGHVGAGSYGSAVSGAISEALKVQLSQVAAALQMEAPAAPAAFVRSDATAVAAAEAPEASNATSEASPVALLAEADANLSTSGAGKRAPGSDPVSSPAVTPVRVSRSSSPTTLGATTPGNRPSSPLQGIAGPSSPSRSGQASHAAVAACGQGVTRRKPVPKALPELEFETRHSLAKESPPSATPEDAALIEAFKPSGPASSETLKASDEDEALSAETRLGREVSVLGKLPDDGDFARFASRGSPVNRRMNKVGSIAKHRDGDGTLGEGTLKRWGLAEAFAAASDEAEEPANAAVLPSDRQKRMVEGPAGTYITDTANFRWNSAMDEIRKALAEDGSAEKQKSKETAEQELEEERGMEEGMKLADRVLASLGVEDGPSNERELRNKKRIMHPFAGAVVMEPLHRSILVTTEPDRTSPRNATALHGMASTPHRSDAGDLTSTTSQSISDIIIDTSSSSASFDATPPPQRFRPTPNVPPRSSSHLSPQRSPFSHPASIGPSQLAAVSARSSAPRLLDPFTTPDGPVTVPVFQRPHQPHTPLEAYASVPAPVPAPASVQQGARYVIPSAASPFGSTADGRVDMPQGISLLATPPAPVSFPIYTTAITRGSTTSAAASGSTSAASAAGAPAGWEPGSLFHQHQLQPAAAMTSTTAVAPGAPRRPQAYSTATATGPVRHDQFASTPESSFAGSSLGQAMPLPSFSLEAAAIAAERRAGRPPATLGAGIGATRIAVSRRGADPPWTEQAAYGTEPGHGVDYDDRDDDPGRAQPRRRVTFFPSSSSGGAPAAAAAAAPHPPPSQMHRGAPPTPLLQTPSNIGPAIDERGVAFAQSRPATGAGETSLSLDTSSSYLTGTLSNTDTLDASAHNAGSESNQLGRDEDGPHSPPPVAVRTWTGQPVLVAPYLLKPDFEALANSYSATEGVLDTFLGLSTFHGWYGYSYRNRRPRKKKRRTSHQQEDSSSSMSAQKAAQTLPTDDDNKDSSRAEEVEGDDGDDDEEDEQGTAINVYDTFGRVRATIRAPAYHLRGGPKRPLPSPRESEAIRRSNELHAVRRHNLRTSQKASSRPADRPPPPSANPRTTSNRTSTIRPWTTYQRASQRQPPAVHDRLRGLRNALLSSQCADWTLAPARTGSIYTADEFDDLSFGSVAGDVGALPTHDAPLPLVPPTSRSVLALESAVPGAFL